MRISDWSSDVCSSDLTLSEIVYGDAPPLRRDADKTPPVRFAPNTMPEPSLDRAERHEVAFQGGMMGMMGGGMMSGRRAETDDMMGGCWSIDGVGATGDVMEWLLPLRGGEPYVAVRRDTAAW